jgi:hypothetical protein
VRFGLVMVELWTIRFYHLSKGQQTGLLATNYHTEFRGKVKTQQIHVTLAILVYVNRVSVTASHYCGSVSMELQWPLRVSGF